MSFTGICRGCGGPVPRKEQGRPKEYCSPRCRKEKYRKPCPECGKPMSGSEGQGPNAPRLCADCNRRQHGRHNKAQWASYAQRRAEEIIALMREDLTDREIAERMGYTRKSMSQHIARLRQRGYELPERSRHGGRNGGRRKSANVGT